MGRIKHALFLAAQRAGYEIRPAWDDWRRLPKIAPTPATIIDVGVADGTPYLYSAFPDADLMLVEPLEEFAADIEALLRRRRGTLHPVAVGRAAGHASINITEVLTRSSIHAIPDWRGEHVAKQRTIQVSTVDALVDEHQPRGPFLLKIDTEGHELDVILGAKKTLESTTCVVAEVSVAARVEDSYRFADFVEAMDDAGFGFADVLTLARRNGRLTFVDAVFLPYRLLADEPSST